MTTTDYVVLCVAPGSLAAVRRWLIAASVNHEPVKQPAKIGLGYFWIVHGGTQKEIIGYLSERGVVAESRTIGPLKAVYVPPQTVAKRRASLFN
jgi:hypothetical protein